MDKKQIKEHLNSKVKHIKDMIEFEKTQGWPWYGLKSYQDELAEVQKQIKNLK